jgi:hypothetical protein
MNQTSEQDKKEPNLEEARQHMREARQAMRKSVEAWLPAGYVENRRKARKEFLMAMRSVVNAAIDRTEHIDEI